MMAKITGTLDPQTLALFKTVMDVWAAAGMNNPDDPESRSGQVMIRPRIHRWSRLLRNVIRGRWLSVTMMRSKRS
jgi:hypothetical protein